MNLWQLITDNSTLPVGQGNTLWDHFNNLGGGAGAPTLQLFDVTEISVMPDIEVDLQTDEYEIELQADEYEVSLEPDYAVEID